MPHQNLELAKTYLELAKAYLGRARNTKESDVALLLCHDTKLSLSSAKKATKHSKNRELCKEIASTYTGLGDVWKANGHLNKAQACYKKAQACYKKAEKWK